MADGAAPEQADAELAARLAAVDERIAEAARSAGRDPSDIVRIVITKFQPVELVRSLAALGVRDVGENRHQEAERKSADTHDLDLRWHFVGQLQSRKARAVRRYAAAVHSLDRDSVVDALADEAAAPLPSFLQVNLTDDLGRGGARPDELERLAERILDTPGVRLAGVMAVAPVDEEPAAAFARLRGYAERVRTVAPEALAISAGMSGDFPAAIAEGATHLRIGTAITGKRPDPR